MLDTVRQFFVQRIFGAGGMNRAPVIAGLGVVGLLASVASPAQAQISTSLVLGARVGARTTYTGTATVPGDGERNIVVREDLRAPWLVAGLRAAYAFDDGLAAELGYTVMWAKVSVDTSATSGGVPVLPATGNGLVQTFVARPRVRLGRLGGGSEVQVFAGPALLWRAGHGFDDYEHRVRIGWNAGLGATLRIAHLRFRADLEDVVSSVKLASPGAFQVGPATRHDLLLTVGLTLP